MKYTLILILFLNLFSWQSFAQSCSSFLSIKPQASITQKQAPSRRQFPRGFWQNSKNLDQIIKILLTKRKTAFLHDLKSDPLIDLQHDFIKAFGLGLHGKKLSTNIRTLRLTHEWSQALARNGHPKTIKEQSQNRVLEVIHKRVENKLDVNAKVLRNDTSQSFQKLLKNVFEESLSPDAYLQRAQKAFGSWSKALKAANLNPDKVNLRQESASEKEIMKVLSRLKDLEFMSWNYEFLRNNQDPRFTQIIEASIQRSLSLAQIHRSAIEIRPWNEWLKKFFKDPRLVVQGNMRFSENEILQVIQNAYKKNRLLNSEAISSDKSSEGISIVSDSIGISVSLQRVYNYAVISGPFRRPWDTWLKQAGLNPRNIRLTGQGLTKDEGVHAIQSLYSQGVALNTGAIMKDTSPQTSQIILSVLGRQKTGRAFYKLALSQGITWVEWLSLAGLDVTQIQLSGRIPYKLVNEITRASLGEIHSNQEALLGRAGSFGFEGRIDGSSEKIRIEEITPEQKLMQKEIHQKFEAFTNILNRKELSMLNALVDLIGSGRDLSELAQGHLSYNGEVFSQPEVTQLILKIKNEPQFYDLISNN